jgi:hypothetical protein
MSGYRWASRPTTKKPSATIGKNDRKPKKVTAPAWPLPLTVP